MYDYSGFEKILKEKNLNKSNLTSLLNISSRTIAKISKNEKIANSVIKKICNYFSCDISDIFRIISDNHILQILRDEKDNKISDGLYHEIQIRMTYNSNRIEGSKLNEEQTRQIFETSTINTKGDIEIDDIIETINHFRAIDYCIDIAEEKLSEEIIKHMHYLIKSRTKNETLSWFNVRDYKLCPNIVKGTKTTDPKDVSESIKKLLNIYNNKEKITLEDIIEFHYNFERIHPFQDGNGRVGRLIAFKECLKNNIIPFIIEDNKKLYYYRGLKEYENEKSYLIDACYDGQDNFKKLLKLFNIKIP